MLPFDERPLVREPDFRLHFHGPLVFDPETRLLDTRRQLAATPVLSVLGRGESGREDGFETSSGGEGAVVTVAECVCSPVSSSSGSSAILSCCSDAAVVERTEAPSWDAFLGAKRGLLLCWAVVLGEPTGEMTARGLLRPWMFGLILIVLLSSEPTANHPRLPSAASLALLRKLVWVPPDVRFHLREPEGEGVNVIFEQHGDAVDEF